MLWQSLITLQMPRYSTYSNLKFSTSISIPAEVYKVLSTVVILCGAHFTDLINGSEITLSSSPWRCCVHTRGTPFCFPSGCGDCGLGWYQRATDLVPRWIYGCGVGPTIDEFLGVLGNCFREDRWWWVTMVSATWESLCVWWDCISYIGWPTSAHSCKFIGFHFLRLSIVCCEEIGIRD